MLIIVWLLFYHHPPDYYCKLADCYTWLLKCSLVPPTKDKGCCYNNLLCKSHKTEIMNTACCSINSSNVFEAVYKGRSLRSTYRKLKGDLLEELVTIYRF